nr:hypothetical protein Iba_chr11dCG13620 [Ipomoea batatas]
MFGWDIRPFYSDGTDVYLLEKVAFQAQPLGSKRTDLIKFTPHQQNQVHGGRLRAILRQTFEWWFRNHARQASTKLPGSAKFKAEDGELMMRGDWTILSHTGLSWQIIILEIIAAQEQREVGGTMQTGSPPSGLEPSKLAEMEVPLTTIFNVPANRPPAVVMTRLEPSGIQAVRLHIPER